MSSPLSDLLDKQPSDDESGDDEGSSDGKEALVDAAKAILDAISQNDPDGLAEALESFVKNCGSYDDEEAPEDDGDKESSGKGLMLLLGHGKK